MSPCCLQIIASAAHVCLYRMSVNEQQWVRHTGWMQCSRFAGKSVLPSLLH
jgi:hypothetical protein